MRGQWMEETVCGRGETERRGHGTGRDGADETRNGSGMERRQDRAKIVWSGEMERSATERSKVKTHGGSRELRDKERGDAKRMNAERRDTEGKEGGYPQLTEER